MTTPEDHARREYESQATEALVPVAETPARLQQGAAGVAEAQAWKGQQIAKGWRKFVKALGLHE
jgi:hypothetical protein